MAGWRGENTINAKLTGAQGFSLIEVTIVVAMLAILLTLAAPSYREYSFRSHRVVAVSQLLQVASCQERVRAESGSYNTNKCIPAIDDHYAFQISPEGQVSSGVFDAHAIPVNAQVRDQCGTLTLGHSGIRSIGNNQANTMQCWSGR